MLLQAILNGTRKCSLVRSKDLINECRKLLPKNANNSFQFSGTQINFSAARRYLATEQKGDAPLQLVIFDKDGTLICVSSTWGPWCMDIADKLKQRIGRDVTKDVYDLFNYDPHTGRVGRGALAENTNEFLQTKLCRILRDQHALAELETAKIIAEVWEKTDPPEAVFPVCDVKTIFSSLKTAKIKVAVCTSDDRKHTERTLEAMDVAHMVDYVLSGSDPHNVPKPAPDNVHLICSELGVHPRHTAVIGDTPSDTVMGRESGVGLVIGVLTGVCNSNELVHADIILENCDKALPLLLRQTQKDDESAL